MPVMAERIGERPSKPLRAEALILGTSVLFYDSCIEERCSGMMPSNMYLWVVVSAPLWL